MSWVTVIWSMAASACLTLAAVYLLVWCHRRTTWPYLLFAVAATATAAVAGGELCLMRAQTPGQLATLVRWIHVPIWVVVVATVAFVRFHLRAGRPWLAWGACVLRTASLLVNFLVAQNLNYREITRVLQVPFLGDTVSLAQGVVNPWMRLGQLSLLFYFAFGVDAAITVWRRRDGLAALLTGSSVAFFILIGGVQATLVVRGVLQWPFTMSLPFLGIVAAMAYELNRTVLGAAQLADALRESEERLREAAEAAGFGIYRFDLVSGTAFYSRELLALYGLPVSATLELDPDLVPKAVHPDDKAIFLGCMKRANDPDGSGILDLEFRILLKGGRERWLRVRGRTVFGGDGACRRPVRANGIIQDVSERKRVEQELGVQRLQLAHVSRVASMGQMASSLAHELSQPLGAILRNAEAAEMILQAPSLDLDEVRAILEDIRHDDQRAGAVIERVRDLMRRRDVMTTPLDLRQLAGDVIVLARPDADRRRVALAVEAGPALPSVQGDRVQLQQVLLNLLLNAMDAVGDSPPREGRVTVRVRRTATAVEVSVIDNGHGIPADAMVRLFEPFYTTKPKGMGVGLPISKSIVEAHGGTLWAANNPEGGATFTFSLPVSAAGRGMRGEVNDESAIA